MGFYLMSLFRLCEHCVLGKGGVSEKAAEHSKTLGERLFFDISLPSPPTFGSKKHWLLIMEDSIDFALTYFLKEKSELKKMMLSLIKDLKATKGINMKYVRCGNARENDDFKRACKQERLCVQFKHTMSGTPQQNSRVKGKFATLFNRVHEMLHCGKFSSFLRNG